MYQTNSTFTVLCGLMEMSKIFVSHKNHSKIDDGCWGVTPAFVVLDYHRKAIHFFFFLNNFICGNLKQQIDEWLCQVRLHWLTRTQSGHITISFSKIKQNITWDYEYAISNKICISLVTFGTPKHWQLELSGDIDAFQTLDFYSSPAQNVLIY